MDAKLQKLHRLMDDTKKAAEIINIPCNEEIIWKLLNAYETGFTEDAVSFRITTKDAQELNLRYQTLRPNDPYKVAVENGFLTPTRHPVHEVMPELQKKRPEAGYFVDLGVTHGLEKIWGYFVHPFTMDELCELESMPRSLKNRCEQFKMLGLNCISAIGVDYIGHSLNIYFLKGLFPNSPEISAQTIREFNFDVPSQDELEFNGDAFVIYPTFTWESDNVERLSYAQGGPQQIIPSYWSPLINKFAAEAPLYSDPRLFTFNTCYGHQMPNYYKLEADYEGRIFNHTIQHLIAGGMKRMEEDNLKFA
jgi:hypothetical protein